MTDSPLKKTPGIISIDIRYYISYSLGLPHEARIKRQSEEMGSARLTQNAGRAPGKDFPNGPGLMNIGTSGREFEERTRS
jgi:hypothetical protein